MKAHARTYHLGSPTDVDADVAEIVLPNNAVAQIAATEHDGPGFLIRVWAPDELMEFGGGNRDCVCLIVRFGPNGAELGKFEFNEGNGSR